MSREAKKTLISNGERLKLGWRNIPDGWATEMVGRGNDELISYGHIIQSHALAGIDCLSSTSQGKYLPESEQRELKLGYTANVQQGTLPNLILVGVATRFVRLPMVVSLSLQLIIESR